MSRSKFSSSETTARKVEKVTPIIQNTEYCKLATRFYAGKTSSSIPIKINYIKANQISFQFSNRLISRCFILKIVIFEIIWKQNKITLGKLNKFLTFNKLVSYQWQVKKNSKHSYKKELTLK